MSTIWTVIFFTSVFFISNSIICAFPNLEKVNDKQKEDALDSPEADSDKELGTVSPTVMEKLEEEIIENQEENAKKFGLPLTNSPEDIQKFLTEEEKQHGTKLPEVIEELVTEGSNLNNFIHFVGLFEKIKSESSDTEEEVVIKSPAEMKVMKAEVFKLTSDIHEKKGLPEFTHEEFDKVWDEKKLEYGKRFPGKIEKVIVLLKTVDEEDEVTAPVKEISETITEASTHAADVSKQESPKGAFVVRSAKGGICILAKFHCAVTIITPGEISEQKVEVTIPPNSKTKGKCAGPNRSPSMQISWETFNFALMFNKTSEDTWGVTSAELSYDTSEPIFDGAIDPGKVTAKSKKLSLFETPFEKSYFCPGKEVILLYNGDQHVATAHLKEVHLQPYDIEDGKFSTSHHCNQVVIDGPDEEPFVQDETVPLAVGCTLALITLLILVGFSVYRAYHAAKVDYNTMP